MKKLCLLSNKITKSIIPFFLFHIISCSSIDGEVSELVSSMTLEEKIGQMTQVDYRYLADKSDIKKYFLGSILSGGGSTPPTNQPSSWVDLYNGFQEEALKTRLKIPLIYGIDAVHGHNNVLGATMFPHNIGLGCMNDKALVQDIAAATAEEVKATGLDWTFAPCVAVAQDERWGRTYESYSEDSDIVTELGVASTIGFQGRTLNKNSVLACAKHFVGDGNTIFGTGTNWYKIDRGDVVLEEEELRSKYIKPFKESINMGVGSIMVSYNSWKGQKLHGHKYLINDVLKKELGFDGIVVSDWAGINELDKDFKYMEFSSYGVDKPWGWEKWYTKNIEENAQYALKMIYMDKGNQSSLQSHLYKSETNFVIFGEANVLYGMDAPDNRNSLINISDLKNKVYKSNEGWSNKVSELHRVVAHET